MVEGKKYMCSICEKMFRSTDFVVKHVKNKHEEKLNNLNSKHFRSKARDNLVTEIVKNQEAQAAAVSSAATSHAQPAHSNSFGAAGGEHNPRGNFFEGRNNSFNSRGDFRSGGRGSGSFYDNDHGGPNQFHHRGGRGRGGYMGRGGGDQNHHHGGHGNNMDDGAGGAMDFDNHGAGGHDKRRGGAAANREYIDYDDPT